MAQDKAERWEVTKPTIATYIEHWWITNKLGVLICECRNRETADLIVTLHNAALDINPSNPMAVAENMGRLVKLIKDYQKMTENHWANMEIPDWLVNIDYQIGLTLAALTKSTGDDKK